MTFDDLLELLRKEDELTVLELLNISTIELVDILDGFIWDKQEHIRNYYGENSEGVGREEV